MGRSVELEVAKIGQNKPVNNIPNKTLESLAAKFLKPGPGTEPGTDIEPYDEIEEVACKWAYCPNPVLRLKGSTLDVIPFLSNSSKCYPQNFNVLLGKYVLICCISLPMSHNRSEYWAAIKSACYELPSDQFQMVVVPLMESDLHAVAGSSHPDPDRKRDLSTLLEFLRDTPGLSIPYKEFLTRLNICSFLGLASGPNQGIGLRSIVVDPSGRILHHMKTEGLFMHYGSKCFPFLHSHIKSIEKQDEVVRCRLDPFHRTRSHIKLDDSEDEYLSLAEDILLCTPSKSLSRCSPTAGPPLTVSELSNKHVGIYVCRTWDFLHSLSEVHKNCIRNGQELEIIFFFMPSIIKDPISPEISPLVAMDSWFNLPLEDEVLRRLGRIFANRNVDDSFIIVPPNCVSGELLGKQLIEMGEKYPFTRRAALERRFTAFSSLNPTSWFKGADEKHTCLVCNGENSNVPQSRVRGKKLLLYFDTPDKDYRRSQLLPLLVKSYPEIKAKGWEVVFIPLDYHTVITTFDDMPWLIMPVDVAARISPYKQLFYDDFGHESSCIVALDEDGKIVSRDAHVRLYKHGIKECLFDNDLYEQIAVRLAKLY